MPTPDPLPDPVPDPHEHHDPFPGFPVDPDVTLEADVPPPRIHTTVIAAVAVGGALGALARWRGGRSRRRCHTWTGDSRGTPCSRTSSAAC